MKNDPTDGRTTRDFLYRGRVVLHQPESGYRFSIDSPLLAFFAGQGRGRVRTCVDLGAGCGVVGLSLLAADRVERVIAVEIQPRLAALARQNAAANGLADRYTVVERDVRDAGLTEELANAELVLSNPPFFAKDEGHLPTHEERRIACHELLGTVRDFLGAGAAILHRGRGRLCAVYPARRVDLLMTAAAERSLACARLRCVHPLADRPAELVLLEVRPGPLGHSTVETPLVLRHGDGTDTPLAASILSGEYCQALARRPDLRAIS